MVLSFVFVSASWLVVSCSSVLTLSSSADFSPKSITVRFSCCDISSLPALVLFNILKDASADLSLWIKSLKTTTNCKSHEKVTKEKLMRQTKETLVNCLLEGYQTVCSQSDKFESSRVFMEQIKSELIAAQRSVVKLQQQILEAQVKQLDTMSTVVDTAVE